MIHWATFETSEPIGGAGGTVLTFKMHHKFGNAWTLGRFRLSVTRGAKPVGLSLPEDFRAILATAPEVRTEAQKTLLRPISVPSTRSCGRKTDAVNASKAPLPIDPKLKELRDQLEFAQRPVQPDPALVELAARSGDERPASHRTAAHRRPGHHLGLDQQPGVPVQPLTMKWALPINRGAPE